MSLQLQIITPLKSILNEQVDEIVVPTESGEITVLPSHVPLLTKIKPGEMIIKRNQKSSFFAITGGFLEVNDNNVTILADYAVRAEDIEVAKAKEAEERAKQTMKEKADKREFAVAEADLRRAIVELQVARRHKRSTPS
ncbi:MAG TPA: F0F1 ATP synthase subunit epsilon [Patescibacteria group bacterium]|nr:F0F1 ATP synthase subunit epsilon [Patescibacteria group bacterium]